MSRQQAREDSFKMLFEAKIMGTSADELLAKFGETVADGDIWEQKSVAKRDAEYMNRVLHGVEENEEELNRAISPHLKRWKIDRLAKVDIAILQLAVFEAFYMDDIPPGVAANEAVELAKKYGGEDAPAFINGVMRSLIRENG